MTGFCNSIPTGPHMTTGLSSVSPSAQEKKKKETSNIQRELIFQD
jgi:hypothetical protein